MCSLFCRNGSAIDLSGRFSCERQSKLCPCIVGLPKRTKKLLVAATNLFGLQRKASPRSDIMLKLLRCVEGGCAPPPSIRTYGTGKVLPFGLVACGRAGLSRNGIIYLKQGARKRGFVRGPASPPFFRHAKDVTRSIDIY